MTSPDTRPSNRQILADFATSHPGEEINPDDIARMLGCRAEYIKNLLWGMPGQVYSLGNGTFQVRHDAFDPGPVENTVHSADRYLPGKEDGPSAPGKQRHSSPKNRRE